MNSSDFSFEPAEFVPFRDRAVLEEMRGIGPEEIVRHDNPDFHIRIIPDNMVQHMWVTKIFHLIVPLVKRGADACSSPKTRITDT